MTDESKNNPIETGKFSGIIRPLETKDLEDLKPILETWIIDRDTGVPLPNEVAEDLELMRASVEEGNGYTYFVAVGSENKAIGVIGMRDPAEKMLQLDFLETKNPVELVNAYVSSDHRAGKGVGTSLVRKVEWEAISRGHTEVVLNSGPRYRDTGWGFYNQLPGYENVGEAVGYYGPGGDAQVWRKDLSGGSD